ncbi:arsenite methyltransferase [Patescibacteria group bacterium]
MKKEEIKKVVKKHYSKIAVSRGCGSCCCGSNNENEQISKSIGYSDSEIESFADANMGLGCGNPTALGQIKEGDIVLDLGSATGFDCFLARKKVGSRGRVIGVDFSKEMIEKAEKNAQKYGYENIDFKYGDIENLPIDNSSIDVVISNCVINLAPDKSKVFKEIYRVLKDKGRAYLSDIVLLKSLSKKYKEDEKLLAGCVAGALLKEDYLKIIKDAGFEVKVLEEDKGISKKQYNNMPLESLKIEAIK